MVRGSTFMASPTEGSGAEAFLQLVIAAKLRAGKVGTNTHGPNRVTHLIKPKWGCFSAFPRETTLDFFRGSISQNPSSFSLLWSSLCSRTGIWLQIPIICLKIPL